MAAGDMAGLMGDHADDLAGMFSLHQQAGVDEQPLPAGDKGIQARILDDMDTDVGRFQPRGLEQRRCE